MVDPGITSTPTNSMVTTATNTSRSTIGVADYFAILGVGEQLVWKHLHKQQQEYADNDPNSQNPTKTENYEEQEWMEERFCREIVDVAIVQVDESTSAIGEEKGDGRTSVTSSVRPQTMTGSTPPVSTKSAISRAHVQPLSSDAHADAKASDGLPSLPTSPTPSDATTALTNATMEEEQRQTQQLWTPSSHKAGWTLVSSTIPVPLSDCSASSARHGMSDAAAAMRTSMDDRRDPGPAVEPITTTKQSSVPVRNHYYGHSSNNKQAKSWQQYCWDANLEWNCGLPGELNHSFLEQHQDLQQQHSGSIQLQIPSNASFSSEHDHQPPRQAPLQGLRRKMEATLRRHLPFSQKALHDSTGPLDNNGHEGAPSSRPPKFYLAYKRRRPRPLHHRQSNDAERSKEEALEVDRDRPAVTNVDLLYVQIHPCLLPQHERQEMEGNNDLTQTRQLDFDSGVLPSETNGPSERFVILEDFLNLPDSADEWSIPNGFQWIRDPKSVTPQDLAAMVRRIRRTPNYTGSRSSKTVLFEHDDTPGSEVSGEGVEAMEAITASTSEEPEDALPYSPLLDPELLMPQIVISSQHPSRQRHRQHSHLQSKENPPPLILDGFVYIPVLAIRRQQVGDEERYQERDTAIVDLAVSFVDVDGVEILPHDLHAVFDGEDEGDDDEEEDEGNFRVLGKSKWSSAGLVAPDRTQRGVKRSATAGKGRRPMGTPIVLSRRNLPYGFADVAFATRVLGRFPLGNYKDLPLPEEELPMFCYPTGCRLHRTRFSDAPLAEYYGFVVKNERGDSIYVSCVSFMEPLTSEKAKQLDEMSEKRRNYSLPHRRFCQEREKRKAKRFDVSASSSDVSTEADSNFLLTGFDDMTTFEKKTICLVSRYPFWTAFRKFLSHLHILSTSTSDLPLERYISHLLLVVPLPKPGGSSVIVPLPTLNNDPMVLSLPPEKDFPLVDIPFQRLVACLDIKTVVTIVLGLLALERKVILISTRPSLVLDVCELLRALLFPFDLCAPYVPRLTEPFKSSLDFPGALFVGIHRDGSQNGLAEIVRRNPPEDSILVDLDTGEVDCDGDRYEVISKAWDIIPATARNVLVSELETLCRDSGIVDGQEPLDSQYDSAFDVGLSHAVEDIGVASSAREPLDDRAVRDAFLRFFCSVLGGYDRFLVAPDADFLVSGNEWFDTQGFLASVSSERSPYLQTMVSTQLFQSFIQRRTEASDVHCLLFDECITEFHSTEVPYGRLGGDVETVTAPGDSQPQMLYSLLVDQSAALPSSSDHMVIASNRSMDASEADSSINMSKASLSLVDYSVKYGESAVNTCGDFVTAPTHLELPVGKRYTYCVDGNPCFPHQLNLELCLPREPDSWVVETLTTLNPLLARSERELEDANRSRRKATSYRGLQTQRRCLWQLPKLMGSHFLGAWLLAIPAQVSQKDISLEQQTRYLMRALGALRLLRSKQRIVPDEAAYRALMVACGRAGSDRRLELVKLFGLLRSDGIFPSAVTLGQYTKALAEGYSKRSSGSGQDDDNGNGVEAMESESRIDISSVVSSNRRFVRDMESALSILDTSLGTLEGHGRRWRYKNGILPGETKGDRKKQANKPWLPVVYSTSFVPCSADQQAESRSDSVRLIAMWSRTRGCSNCAYVPLEEEIQAGWDVVGGENDVPGAIACPRCSSLIVPMLGYKEVSLEEALLLGSPNLDTAKPSSKLADFDELPPQVGPSVDADDSGVSYVAYVSPATLRLALEHHLEEHGEEVLEREVLRRLDSEVFFNLWWYCARFSLPLPLPVSSIPSEDPPAYYCTFAAWDRSGAERGCMSAAKVLTPLLDLINGPGKVSTEDEVRIDSFEDIPLLSRFNLQGFYSTVWDHVDLSSILVKLVEACDKHDFKPVVEVALECNKRRRQQYDPIDMETGSDINSAHGRKTNSSIDHGVGGYAGYELDIYRTILYLAKYQCTTAFHAFFPATSKPCKGYHFWCASGTPVPIFDRLLRDGIERAKNSNNGQRNILLSPIHDVSDVALGFRCVFGHLI